MAAPQAVVDTPSAGVIEAPDTASRAGTPLGHRAAIWTALFVTVLWSSSWVLIRWGLDDEDLPPLTFAGLRYASAAVILVAWLVARRRPEARSLPRDRRLMARLVLLGILLITAAQGAQFVALANQPAATTSLVLGFAPLLVAGAAALSLGEVPTRRQLLGVLLVALGTALFAAGDLWATPLGMAAALVGLIAVALSSILGRDVNRSARLSPALVTAVSMSVGATLLLGVGFVVEDMPALTLGAWLLIGWLAVVNTAFAFTLWNRSLQGLSAVESAAINNTMAIQVALLAWFFLGEWPGLAGLAGILVAMFGILLVQRRAVVEPVRAT